MHSPGPSSRHVAAEIQLDSAGKPRAFALVFERERVILDPVTSWAKTDQFKWVTRGIIEQPQSFHVHPDGTVEINGEKINPHDPEAVRKLEHEINKHHEAAPAARATTEAVPRKPSAPARPADRVSFHVRLDHFGHLQIECFAGEEKTLTGLRGLSSLIQNGLMLKPAQFHVDPMQRHLELDGTRFECNEEGARQLESALNARYAPKLKDPSESPVEIRENSASPSGFDIRFVTIHAGARFEIKGHLDQEKLDLLQDPAKCNLLKPGILFRLVPPLLLVRRRRSDGGEERVPEMPDLEYLRASALELQQIFNHPLVRRGAVGAASAGSDVASKPDLAALRVRRNPQNKLVLWLESVSPTGDVFEARALTHHNLAELQHQGAFLPHLDVTLSLDNRTLSMLDRQTGQDQHRVIEPASPDDDLDRAGQWLTAALRPPPPPPIPTATAPQPPAPETPPPLAPLAPTSPPAPPPPIPPPAPVTPPPPARASAPPPVALRGTSTGTPIRRADAPPPATTPAPRPSPAAANAPLVEAAATPTAPPGPETDDAGLAALGFPTAEPLETMVQVFRTLAADAGLPVQDVLLSLPMAFTDRRFEILAFDGQPIESVLELRAEGFAGFYLTHLHPDNVLLVYASRGRHVEFGSRRCELQPSVAAEPDEFPGPGLLGLAQDREGNFIFLVNARFRAWASSREKAYLEAGARFLTPAEAFALGDDLTRIWPPAAEQPQKA